MLLVAMVSMVLVAAAPAFAHTVVTSEDDIDSSVNQFVSSAHIQIASANQANYGDASAAADDGSATASISQDLTINQSAVQNTVAAGGDANVAGTTSGFFVPDFFVFVFQAIEACRSDVLPYLPYGPVSLSPPNGYRPAFIAKDDPASTAGITMSGTIVAVVTVTINQTLRSLT